MPNILVTPDKLCTGVRKDGLPCQAPRNPRSLFCTRHDPDTWGRVQRKIALRAGLPHATDVSLEELTSLDLERSDALRIARRGIWQHLIAGDLPPHVAKVALEVAETVAKSGARSTERESVADAIARRLSKGDTSPTPGDAEAGGEGDSGARGSE